MIEDVEEGRVKECLEDAGRALGLRAGPGPESRLQGRVESRQVEAGRCSSKKIYVCHVNRIIGFTVCLRANIGY